MTPDDKVKPRQPLSRRKALLSGTALAAVMALGSGGNVHRACAAKLGASPRRWPAEHSCLLRR
jgi:DNA-binding transcriptional regulator YbjK